jgi:membrane protein DedA with SNARE-associated domain
MVEEILKAIPVFLASMIKFIFGPLSGYAAGLTVVTTILSTVGGMMTVVFAFTYFGSWLRNNLFKRFFPNSKIFTSRSRKFSMIWKKYGLVGVAALTPLILTPIGGTILAVSSGSPKEKIILYMFISACFWGVSLTLATYFFGHAIWPDFIK